MDAVVLHFGHAFQAVALTNLVPHTSTLRKNLHGEGFCGPRVRIHKRSERLRQVGDVHNRVGLRTSLVHDGDPEERHFFFFFCKSVQYVWGGFG